MMNNNTIFAVLKYLKENNYEQSWLALQNQSQIKLYSYPRQLQFLRKILLKGDFNQAILFFNTLQPHLSKKIFKNSCLTIYKQKLYQLINQPNQTQLKKLFQKQLLNYCTQQQFQNLFKLLTYRKCQQIQGLNNWTISKGRLKVFQEILPIVQSIININNNNNSNNYLNKMISSINLDEAIAMYMQQSNNKNHKEITDVNQTVSNSKIYKKSDVNVNNISHQFNKNYKDQYKKQIQLDLSQSQYNKSLIINAQKKPQINNNPSYLNNNITNRQLIKSNNNTNINNSSLHNNLKQDLNNYHNPHFDQDAQINQISQEQQKSQNINQKSNAKIQDSQNNSQFNDQSQKDNIQQLQQTNSLLYNHQADRYHQNFTFSNQTQIIKPKQIVKLATISDQKAIRTCKFSNSGNFFAVGTNSSYLKIFYVQDIFQQNKLQLNFDPIYQINNLHSKSIFCLDWANNQTSMVTCSNDLTIKVTQFDQNFTSHEISVIGRHQSCIRMVKFNEEHNKIFSCGDDSLVKVWDMGKVKRCYNLKGHKAGITAFKLTQNQNQLYTVSKDSTIKKWDLRSLDCVATSKSQQSQITFIADNTNRIVVSNRNGNVLFFDQNLDFQYQVKIHQQQIRSIQYSKSKDLFLTASFDGHVGIFSQKTCHSPDYFQHNQIEDDKVVFATFLNHSQHKGFASTSTLGLCHIYSYF